MRPFLTLHDPAKAKLYYDAGLWHEDTLYGLLQRQAAASPEALALVDGQGGLTWSQTLQAVDSLAAAFEQQGLTAGDRLSLWMGNGKAAVLAFLAASRQGIACNPSLHRTYTAAEVRQLLERLGSRLLITEEGWGAETSEAQRQAALQQSEGLEAIWDAASLPLNDRQPTSDPQTNPDSVTYLAFTSGTTGLPKCVMHSANSLLANARDLARDWSLGPDDVLLSLSPLSHHIAWVAVGQWLVAGCRLVTDDPPPGSERLDWLLANEATYVMGVPTHAMDMLAAQKARGLGRLGQVRTFYMAGAAIPPSVAEAFVVQGIKPQNIYGMTENSSHQYTHPDDPIETSLATCGRGGPAYEVAIADPEDPERLLGPGEIGEIVGRGAALMLGYYDNQSAIDASFTSQGWFRSGDLGALDEAGNLTIHGRLKDLIIRGGHNIHPSHIEALALRHPAVEKAAAFAVPDERLGEKVCLAILGTAEPEPLLTHLAGEGLSRYDMPEYFLRMEAFPLTPSGKILKRTLSEDAKAGRLTPDPIRYHAKESGS
ncbi:MAG: class I adenylate-forming enzyme family protein [Kiloniellales bacterium]